MRVEPHRVIAIGLHRGDQGRKRCQLRRERFPLRRGSQEDLLDGLVKAPAQLAQELAIVLETEAQHFGDGDDILADREFAQNLLVDVFGEEQGALPRKRDVPLVA